MAGNSITDKAYQETGDCPMPPVHIPCLPNPGPSAGTAMQGRDPRDIPFRQKLGVCSREYLIGRKQHTLCVKLRKDVNVRIDICGAIWNAGCTLMREYYKNTGKTMSKGMLYGQLGQMRKHTPSWSLVYSQVLQQIADRILDAYELFFTNAEKKRNGAKLKCSPPKCHKVRKQRSMTFKQYGKGFSFTGPGEVRIQGKKFRYYDSYCGLLEYVKGYDPIVHVNAIKELVEGGCTYLALCTVDVPYVRNYIKQLIDSGIKVITVNSLLSVKCLIVTGSLSQKGHNERIKGFEDGLERHNIPYRRIAVVESLDSDETSYERTLRELDEHPEINRIFIVAAGVEGCLRAAKEKRAKENGVYVMSFDDIDATKKLIKEGAIEYTICQEPFRQGYRSLSDLIQYIIDNEIGKNDYITNNIIKIKENID